MKYRCFWIVFAVILLISCEKKSVTADTVSAESSPSQIIILNNGSEYRGTLVQITPQRVLFNTGDQTMDIDVKDVNKINFSRKRLYENLANIRECKDADIVKAFQASRAYKQSANTGRYVNILRKTVYNLDGNHALCTITRAVKILNKQGLELSTQYFNYLKKSGSGRLNYALTIDDDGNISHIDESAINDEPLNNKYPLYDNEHRIKFGHKNVDENSFIIWQAEIDIDIDDIFAPLNVVCTLMDDEPILDYRVEINHDKNVKLSYDRYEGLFPMKKPHIKNGSTKFVLTASDIAPCHTDEDNTPSASMLLPKVVVQKVSSYEEISDRYASTFFGRQDSQAADFAKKITSGQNTDDPKALADVIYYYINRNIELVGVSMGQCSYVPNEFGRLAAASGLNVLDKSYMFTQAAGSLGIDASMIFYATTDMSFADKTCSIANFNNVICKINANAKDYYYSFVNKNYSAGVIPYNASKAFALDVSTKSDLSRLPQVESAWNATTRKVDAVLNADGSLTFRQTTRAAGDAMTSWRDLRYLSKEQLDRFIKKRALSFGKNVTVDGYGFVSDFDDYDSEIVFEESYTVHNFAFNRGDNILFKMSSLGFDYTAGSVSKQSRLLPYDLSGISSINCTCTIALPSGYNVSYCPSELISVYESGRLNVRYEFSDGKLNLTFNQSFDDRYVSTDGYADFKRFAEARAGFFAEWIVLTK